MIRAAELAVFLAPLAAFLLWRAARARGLNAPPPRQLALILAALAVLGGLLFVFSDRDRLPPGRYVPAHQENGQIVEGHTE